MTGSIRAPVAPRWARAAAAFYVVVVLGAIAAPGQSAESESKVQYTEPAKEEPRDSSGPVKAFDFNERPLGNYEETPMFWTRLVGEGLPAYSSGRLDDTVGHAAPPSFLLTLRGGSVVYEYAQQDLAVLAGADYRIDGYVRTEGLEYARAFIACYLVGRDGQRISGSDRISDLVGPSKDTLAAADAGWQRVEIVLPGDFPGAQALRVQLWVLQGYVWRDPDEKSVDPIIRQDVRARVWFDDITISRLPRLRLALSHPAGLIQPDADASFVVELHNATLSDLSVELTVSDEAGVERFRTRADVAPTISQRLEIAVPSLPAGFYHARARLLAGADALLERARCFAVLPALPTDLSDRRPDLGVDLGPWPHTDPATVAELITALGCGAVKLGVPMIGAPRSDAETEYLHQIRDLARVLATDAIETTGVVLSPAAASNPHGGLSTCRMIAADPDWDTRAGPLFALLGGQVSSWQLGSEPLELRWPGEGSAPAIEQVRSKLERVIPASELIVPCSVLDTAPTALLSDEGNEPAVPVAAGVASPGTGLKPPHANSYWVPADLPAQAYPWLLAFCLEPRAGAAPGGHSPERWLSLALDRGTLTSPTDRLADLARRIVLAKTVNPDRVYVPAPFEYTTAGGGAGWQPTAEFIPLRTLFRCLAGRRAIASLALESNGVGVLFGGGGEDVLVVWTWQPDGVDVGAELDLGPAATGLELSGAPRALPRDGARVRVPLQPAPLIITHVDGPLLLLQDSFRVAPAFIQLHIPEPRPVLSLRNCFETELSGTVDLQPPDNWAVTPRQCRLQLAPGVTFTQALDFAVPPRQIATQQPLRVDVHLERPAAHDLHFEVPLRVGLEDVDMTVAISWNGDELIVEQSLHNLSALPASFDASCQAPGRPRAERLFLNVPPEEVRTQTYRFRAARALAGRQLWLGLQEIRGPRNLDQVVPIPR